MVAGECGSVRTFVIGLHALVESLFVFIHLLGQVVEVQLLGSAALADRAGPLILCLMHFENSVLKVCVMGLLFVFCRMACFLVGVLTAYALCKYYKKYIQRLIIL